VSSTQFIDVEIVYDLAQLRDDAFLAHVRVLARPVFAACAAVVDVPAGRSFRFVEFLLLEAGDAAALAAHHHAHEGEFVLALLALGLVQYFSSFACEQRIISKNFSFGLFENFWLNV